MEKQNFFDQILSEWHPYHLNSEEIVKLLDSDIELGLTQQKIKERVAQFGRNVLPEQKEKNIGRIILDQLLNPIIYILIFAVLLAIFFNDWLEAIAVLIVIFITVLIGFFMELKAIKSLKIIQEMGQSFTRVLRDGIVSVLKSSLIVPGDIIILEVGDVVTADARIISLENLTLKESILTGESVPTEKQSNVLPLYLPVIEQSNMVFKGTLVTRGMGKAIVVSTGINTELGKIQQLGFTAKKSQTPLEKKLNKLSKQLILLTIILSLLIVITGYFRGNELIEMLQTGVALAVASIPEGLPIVATIALAQGMLKLSKNKVVIKKLEAVQTLGATTIICTDKTGTLTEDQMKVHTLVFEPVSYSNIKDKNVDFFNDLKKTKTFNQIIKTAVLCNDSIVTTKKRQGDAMDLALIDFAVFTGYNPLFIQKNNPKKMEMAFDTESKMMATVNQNNNEYSVYAKGAFESIVNCCPLILINDEVKQFNNKDFWSKKVDDLASEGLRVIAFAFKNVSKIPTSNFYCNELIFIGIIGFIDPARVDVKPTISIYKNAGIRVVMMTGDHPGTAMKIAKETGLLSNKVKKGSVIIGNQIPSFKKLKVKEKNKLLNATIFARVTPKQKLNIISLFQQNNEIVGMIGDGINDVPALKKADIGIAMGIRGTEAARESADVILKDDKFTTIALGIQQGRVIFNNIRQFVVYLLSSNLAEIISVGFAALLNLPSPLLPLQILFLNLITDIFPALALGFGKGEKDIMSKSPQNPLEPIMTIKLWKATIVYGLCITAGVLGITIYAYYVLKSPSQNINNMAFFTLIFAQLLNVFNLPKHHLSFFKNEVTTNIWVWIAIIFCTLITITCYNIPSIAKALSIISISKFELILILLFGFGSLLLTQLIKRIGGVF